MPRPTRRSRARLTGAAVATLALTLVTACSQGPSAKWRGPGGTASEGTKVVGAFKITPAENATEISVLDPITVAAEDATIESVSVKNPEGKEVKGELDAEKRNWKTSEPLGYAKEYTVTAVGMGAKGDKIEKTSKFTTIKPKNQTMPYLRASDGKLLSARSTYGIGQTVQLFFDEPIKDKAAAQKQLEVKVEPEVEGGWYWHSAQKVEWRTAEYLKPGTTVSVKGKFYGRDLGDGLYGQGDISGSFKVGQSKIAVVDNNTKMMQVFIDGQKVRDIPVANGKGGWKTLPNGSKIHYWTTSGKHVVLGKAPETRMTSASYGVKDKNDPEYYDEKIKYTVQMTTDGIFTHLADWHRRHGQANISHGCINLPPGHAEWFYNTFDAGDVVDVKNTPIAFTPAIGNGAWTISWEQWKKGSAI